MIITYVHFKPVISIIMATFNRADYLEKSINSVLKQSFKEWELLIIDDGSKDNSFDIINKYVQENENIIYLKHQHRKLPLSRNSGMPASCGEFITFLDSDDEYNKNHLLFRFNFMKGRPDVDLIHGGVQIIGDPYVADRKIPGKKIHLEQCAIGGTFFGKRKVFFDLEGFANIPYSEDSDFLERAEEKFNIQKVGYPTYIYNREVRDSITNLKEKESGKDESKTQNED
jgi:glycosyltransferase involved in cell wall biosynthesis